MTKTNCKELEDETITTKGASPPVLSRGSKNSPSSIVASGFAVMSDAHSERKGGIKVLHNTRVRFDS
jgi:hypothetical protein